MANGALILAIDQGTTSSRAIVFDETGHPVATAQQEFHQIFPHDGWVEHDPEEIWSTTLSVSVEAKQSAEAGGGKVAAIGITNQRETTIIWDRATGTPIYNAIVWQDRRTSATCDSLRGQGAEDNVTVRTGLLLDPYFSATKIAWILDHVDGARARAEAGELAFGTIDCFLLWRLTNGAVHATDASNAARTLLMNIETGDWDPALLKLFDVPAGLLPEIRDNAADFGTTNLLGGAISVAGMAGDQQAATIGQACFAPGMVKSTYGTGCFALMNTGAERVISENRLLSTVAFRLSGKTTYALEGSIFVAGAAVQWLRDGLKLIDDAAETEALAKSVEDTGGVYLVPAFVGLGAPWWDAEARGAIYGLTRDTTDAHIVRAALEAVCYQTHDLVAAMSADSGTVIEALRVDGGMVANDWLLQSLANITGVPVERPVQSESTALGAAMLAGMQAGIWPDLDTIGGMWARDARFEPKIQDDQRNALISGWRSAIEDFDTMSKRRIWESPIRVFHILLILLISISWYTAENMHVFSFGPQSGPSQFDLHRWSGYCVLTLVLARILWGLVGSTTGRFTHFLKGPKGIAAYTSKLFGNAYQPSVGHNPIGGWSVVLMLALLLAQTITGLLSSEDTFGLEGPLDHLVSTPTSYWLAGIHEIIFNTLLVVLVIHIGAALFYLFVKKDNLILPMITGRKEIDGAEDLVFRPVWIPLSIAAVAGGLVWAAISYL